MPGKSVSNRPSVAFAYVATCGFEPMFEYGVDGLSAAETLPPE